MAALPPRSEPVGGLCRFRSRSFLCCLCSWDESPPLVWLFSVSKESTGQALGSPYRKCVTGQLEQLNHEVYFSVKQHLMFKVPYYYVTCEQLPHSEGYFDTAVSLGVSLH